MGRPTRAWSLVSLSCQAIKQCLETRDRLSQILQPNLRAPDLDAHGRADQDNFSARLDAEELTKAFGNEQSSAAGDLDLTVSGGK